VHHILGGRQRWVRFSGVATEWDFVEAPSQLLEEWAWDAGILRSFATNADGQPIPTELVARMRAAKEFGKGYFARTQMFYAAASYRLHLDRPADLTAAVQELQARYDLFGSLPGTHFEDSFGHLEAYTSAYYTYMWSLVIAKDMFSAFRPDDLFDAAVAHRYRDEILARGGSEDAAALVADFLGRPYSFDAFGAWLDTPIKAPRSRGPSEHRSVGGEQQEAFERHDGQRRRPLPAGHLAAVADRRDDEQADLQDRDPAKRDRHQLGELQALGVHGEEQDERRRAAHEEDHAARAAVGFGPVAREQRPEQVQAGQDQHRGEREQRPGDRVEAALR
jgi:hypothetical protein